MKKKVFRERYRDADGYIVKVIGAEKPEILPFDEGGFTIDENGDIKEVRIKPKRGRKPKGDK